MTRFNSIPTKDSPYRLARDEVLNAIPPGKVLVNGLLWTGELAPLLDATLSAVESVYTAPGLSLGHALNAEGVQTPQLLGRTWLDNVATQIKRASADAKPDDTDVTAILSDIELLRGQMGTRELTGLSLAGMQDSIRRLRRSLDSTRTSDARRPIGAWTKGLSGDAINDKNKAFWATRTTSDAAMGTAARDALAAAHKAKRPGELGEALNVAHKAFWALDNRPATPTAVAPAAPSHPWAAAGEEMNRKAREFWANRT